MTKQILFSAACIAALALSSCKDKVIPEITPEKMATADYQKVLYYDITATWCPPCGSYGIPDFKAALAADTSAVGFSIHSSSSDGMYTPIAVELDKLVYPPTGADGIPAFGEGITGYTQSMAQAKGAGAIRKAENPVPLAGLGVRQKISGDTMRIDARVKFLKADAGNKVYALGVYILQDSLIYAQQGVSTNPFRHDHVLVAKATTGYGETIKSGAVATTDNIGKSYTFIKNKPSQVLSNMYATVVLWEVNAAGKPIAFINANQVKIK